MNDEMYTELPADEVYEELTAEMTGGIQKPNPESSAAPPVPETRRPFSQAPQIPDRNPNQARDLPQLPPQLAPVSGKSKFYDQPSPLLPRRPPQAPASMPSSKGAEPARVSQAFQIFIQSKRSGNPKSHYSTPWAKRVDPSGPDVEFIPLQGSGSSIPFVPPCILVKMPQGTEIANGNYLRLFIPPASASQQPPPRATTGGSADMNESDLVYDETTLPNDFKQETYDEVVQMTETQDTYDDVIQKPEPPVPISEPDLTYDDIANVKENDITNDDVIPKSKPNSTEQCMESADIYDDVEISRVSNRSSPTPSDSSGAGLKGKGDKKAQKLEEKRIKKREKSIKGFKQFGIKQTDPYLQELVSQTASEKSKDKEMIQIAEGEKVQLLVQEHPKLKAGHWLVEKADGSIGLANSSLFN